MAQDIALMNAVFPDVPAVLLPKSGGGQARFTDVSDTDAVAADVTSGKWFYTANGTRTQGTNSGGGSSGLQVAMATATPETSSDEITFSVLGQPTSFMVIAHDALATGASPYKVAAIVYDGSSEHGSIITNTSNAQVSYIDTNIYVDSDGDSLTIVCTEAHFQAIQYDLIYTYDSSAGDIGTKEVQVGSGATNIAFTGLSQEPDFWYLIFKSNFSTSSGYQRVIAVVNDGSSIRGLEMDSGAHYSDAHWSASYSNGTLTISSQGTNAGGYFHQPGYYQLVYGNGEIEPVEIEIEPLSVTQNGTYTAPANKAYSPVTVNVPSGGSVNVDKVTWTNNSTSTVSHQFTGLKGTPKFAVLRCTSQLTRSSSNTYYYIADIIWDGTNTYGNYHLRSNGSFNNVASDAQSGFNVTTGTNSITFSSDASSRSSAPGSFYNGTYELTYVY